MEIYLVRHGVAEKRDPARWPDDRNRPLSPGGEAAMRRAARGLATLAPEAAVLLSSPLARAWRTAEILHEEIGWPEPNEVPELEPDCEPEETEAALTAYAGAGSVALAGHEPHLSLFAAYLLTGDDEADIQLKKGGVVCLETGLGVVRGGEATLRWLITPKALRALA